MKSSRFAISHKKKHQFLNPQYERVYSIDGVSPTLDMMQGGNRQPKIMIIE